MLCSLGWCFFRNFYHLETSSVSSALVKVELQLSVCTGEGDYTMRCICRGDNFYVLSAGVCRRCQGVFLEELFSGSGCQRHMLCMFAEAELPKCLIIVRSCHLQLWLFNKTVLKNLPRLRYFSH